MQQQHKKIKLLESYYVIRETLFSSPTTAAPTHLRNVASFIFFLASFFSFRLPCFPPSLSLSLSITSAVCAYRISLSPDINKSIYIYIFLSIKIRQQDVCSNKVVFASRRQGARSNIYDAPIYLEGWQKKTRERKKEEKKMPNLPIPREASADGRVLPCLLSSQIAERSVVHIDPLSFRLVSWALLYLGSTMVAIVNCWSNTHTRSDAEAKSRL